MEERVLNKDVELFTKYLGDKTNEAVILLHGGPSVPENLDPIAERLANNYFVIYFHQRGTQKSPCISGNYSMESYVSDIDCIASHFKLSKFHLFGHSWGGLYAGVYADKHPERIRSMFLSSPATGTGKQWAKMGLEVRAFQKRKSTFLEWLRMLKNSFLGLVGFKSAFKKFYCQFAINCNKGHLEKPSSAPLILDLLNHNAAKATNKEILKFGNLPEFGDKNIKITLSFGDDDIYGSSINFVKQRYPFAKLITLEKSGHMQWLHNPRSFYKNLGEHFIKMNFVR